MRAWALRPPCGFGVRLPRAKSQQSGLHDPCSLKDPGSSPGKDWNVWLLPTQKTLPCCDSNPVALCLWASRCSAKLERQRWQRQAGLSTACLGRGPAGACGVDLEHLCPSAVSSRLCVLHVLSQDKETQALGGCPAAGGASEAMAGQRGQHIFPPISACAWGREEHSSTQRALGCVAALLCPRGPFTCDGCVLGRVLEGRVDRRGL